MGKMALRVEVFGEKQDPASILVEPVDNSEPGIGGARPGQVDLMGEGLENARVLPAAGNGRQAGGFVDGDVVVRHAQHIQITFASHAPSVADWAVWRSNWRLTGFWGSSTITGGNRRGTRIRAFQPPACCLGG